MKKSIIFVILAIMTIVAISTVDYKPVTRDDIAINLQPIKEATENADNITWVRGFIPKERINSKNGAKAGGLLPGWFLIAWVLLGWLITAGIFAMLGNIFPKRDFSFDREGFPWKIAIHVITCLIVLLGFKFNLVPREFTIFSGNEQGRKQLIKVYGEAFDRSVRQQVASGHFDSAWQMYNRYSIENFNPLGESETLAERDQLLYRQICKGLVLEDPDFMNWAYQKTEYRITGKGENYAHLVREALAGEDWFADFYLYFRWPILQAKLEKAKYMERRSSEGKYIDLEDRMSWVQREIELDLFPVLQTKSDVWKWMRKVRREYLQDLLSQGYVLTPIHQAKKEGHLDEETLKIFRDLILSWIDSDISKVPLFIERWAKQYPLEYLETKAVQASFKAKMVRLVANVERYAGLGNPNETIKMAEKFKADAWFMVERHMRKLDNLATLFSEELPQKYIDYKTDEVAQKLRTSVFKKMKTKGGDEEEVLLKVANMSLKELRKKL
ncbi:MAG: hypothetical protein ABIC04_02200 [Nanoarchaeota archaeon]